MEPIKQTKLENVILGAEDAKQRITKKIISHAGTLCSSFIVFVAAVVLTADVKLTSLSQLAELGVSFVLLMFLTYSMYFSCSDSGTRAGAKSELYRNACSRYEEAKRKALLSENSLSDFCRAYRERELKNSRSDILAEVGITYSEYEARFLGKDLSALEKEYGKLRLNAVKRANRLKPVRLTPDMLCKRGRKASRRGPLGMNPNKRKTIKDVLRVGQITLTSVLTGAVVFDVVVDFSWATVAGVFLKLLPVVINGFYGYKSGYENIVIDKVNYMNDQTDLLEEASLV